MIITFTTQTVCGETTCAESKGIFCKFFTHQFMQEGYGYCLQYDKLLRENDDGWIVRCDECLKEHKNKYQEEIERIE
jgi:hypothetical protein